MQLEWSKFLLDTDNNIEFITPIVLEKDNEYFSHVKALLKKIKDKLILLNFKKEYVDIANDFSNKIIGCIQKYYEGDLMESCRQMQIILREFEKDGLTISKVSNSISFNYPDYSSTVERDALRNIEFYRARISDSVKTFNATEMLHVPFNQREKISSGRFSIPGLPCLYLGSTSYCCWVEMRNPADYSFNVSLVRLEKDFKILNLTINSHVLLDKSENVSDRIMKKLFKLWLLTIVTSYKVKQEGRNFKSEYIVSQMIMLACKKQKVDGVAFLSKQLKNDVYAIRACVNLALLPSYDNREKLSIMCDYIVASDSFNYSMYKQLRHAATYKQPHLYIDDSPISIGIGEYQKPFLYQDTYFYKFDQFLKSICDSNK